MFAGGVDSLLAVFVERDERYQSQRRSGRTAYPHCGVEESTCAGTITDGTRDGTNALHVGVPGASRSHGHGDRREMQKVVDE